MCRSVHDGSSRDRSSWNKKKYGVYIKVPGNIYDFTYTTSDNYYQTLNTDTIDTLHTQQPNGLLKSHPTKQLWMTWIEMNEESTKEIGKVGQYKQDKWKT